MICSPFLSKNYVIGKWTDNKSYLLRVRSKTEDNSLFRGANLLLHLVRHKSNMIFLLDSDIVLYTEFEGYMV